MMGEVTPRASRNTVGPTDKIIHTGGAGVILTPVGSEDFLDEFPFPFSEFGYPQDIGLTPERIANLKKQGSPRESEG